MIFLLTLALTLSDMSHAVRVEPAMTKQAKGATYTDPIFGTRIKRLTDAAADGAAGYVCYYSKLDPFNADETKVLFYRHGVGHWLVYDMQAETYARVTEIFNPQTDPQPRWHPTDTNKIRFFSANKIVELNLIDRVVTTLASFPEYQFITNHDEWNWDKKWKWISNLRKKLAVADWIIGVFRLRLDAGENRFSESYGNRPQRGLGFDLAAGEVFRDAH